MSTATLHDTPFVLHKLRHYGWRPQKPDARDHRYTAPSVSLPPKFDLLQYDPPIYDQGQLGSCTGNAWASEIEADQIREGMKLVTANRSHYSPYIQQLSDHASLLCDDHQVRQARKLAVSQIVGGAFTPSRLFIYYCERALEGTTAHDDGAEIRDGAKALAKWGYCPETLWPYNVKKFAQQPPAAAYTNANPRKIGKYELIANGDLNAVKTAIYGGGPAAPGNGVVGGFTVYSSFEGDQIAKNGLMPLPNFKTEKVEGGHAIKYLGYDDTIVCPGTSEPGALLTRNSWGPAWGWHGYFWMPYAFFTMVRVASDNWVATWEPTS